MSLQHSDKIQLEDLRAAVKEHVIKTVIPSKYYDDETIVHINPCGLFIIGGPMVSRLDFSLLKFVSNWM